MQQWLGNEVYKIFHNPHIGTSSLPAAVPERKDFTISKILSCETGSRKMMFISSQVCSEKRTGDLPRKWYLFG